MPAACTGMPHAVLQRWADLRAQFSLFYITLAAPSQGHYHFNKAVRLPRLTGFGAVWSAVGASVSRWSQKKRRNGKYFV